MSPKQSPKKNGSKVPFASLIAYQWTHELRHVPRICDSLDLLSDDEIWWRPNEVSNGVGNLVLHLCGNMRQWIIAGLGGAEDIRERDLKFSERGPIPRADLLKKFCGTVQEASRVIERLSLADLTKKYRIQGYRVTGYGAVMQVAADVAYHAGQIIYSRR